MQEEEIAFWKYLSAATDSRAPKLWAVGGGGRFQGSRRRGLSLSMPDGLWWPPTLRQHMAHQPSFSQHLAACRVDIGTQKSRLNVHPVSFKAGRPTLAMRTAFPPQSSVSAAPQRRTTHLHICPESKLHRRSLAALAQDVAGRVSVLKRKKEYGRKSCLWVLKNFLLTRPREMGKDKIPVREICMLLF